MELSDASSVVVQPLTTVDESDPICAAVKNEMDMFYIPFVAAYGNPSVGRLLRANARSTPESTFPLCKLRVQSLQIRYEWQ